MSQNLNIFIAFIAGVASFISPCVLPIVPSYLAQLVGPGIIQAQLTAAPNLTPAQKRLPLWHALAFVAGFSTAFIALGATASIVGSLLRAYQEPISRIGGVVLILMGLHFAGFIQIPLLYREGRVQWRPGERGFGASYTIGLIFALGWTPCIGVILTLILGLAAQSATLGAGVILLAAYSLGLGLPFILMGAAFDRARALLRPLSPHLGTIERVTGILIAVMGFLIFNGWLLYLNHYFSFVLPGI